MTSEKLTKKALRAARPPLAVQILTIVGFTGFAIPVSIVAMSQFGVLGLLLAAFLGWQWTRIGNFATGPDIETLVAGLKPQTDPATGSSGNASFDAYRAELLARLEDEQEKFHGFLDRLREAKDKTEFDAFMDDRERLARPGQSPAEA